MITIGIFAYTAVTNMSFSENSKLTLVDVNDAAPFAGDLFLQSFGDTIPDFPKHFVLLLSDKSKTLTLGYVHFTQKDRMYLGGGMCVNTRALRQVPTNIRKQLSAQGGVAFTMLSESVKLLSDCDAVFGHVGHQGAYKIDLAVGFEQTEHNHLIVFWQNKELSPADKAELIDSAHQEGAF